MMFFFFLVKRYLTPTEEIVEKKEGELEITMKQEKSETDTPKTIESVPRESADDVTNIHKVAFREEGQGDVNNKENISDSDTITNKPEAVPIVETSAVSVELEPSNNESSLGEKNVQSSDTVSKVEEAEGTVVSSEEEVPPVENIPTISQFCDPSHYDSTTNTATDVVVKDVTVGKDAETSGSPAKVPAKSAEVVKRRVSLPSNHSEGQTAEFAQDASVHHVSPQKRPRSASTSTQVDPNLFGKIHIY